MLLSSSLRSAIFFRAPLSFSYSFPSSAVSLLRMGFMTPSTALAVNPTILFLGCSLQCSGELELLDLISS
uniref:Uncharacterized protein n=1 Tax=Arundo donax TaxID=35708 RepID=A0A0A9A5F9_ARUDO